MRSWEIARADSEGNSFVRRATIKLPDNPTDKEVFRAARKAGMLPEPLARVYELYRRWDGELIEIHRKRDQRFIAKLTKL